MDVYRRVWCPWNYCHHMWCCQGFSYFIFCLDLFHCLFYSDNKKLFNSNQPTTLHHPSSISTQNHNPSFTKQKPAWTNQSHLHTKNASSNPTLFPHKQPPANSKLQLNHSYSTSTINQFQTITPSATLQTQLPATTAATSLQPKENLACIIPQTKLHHKSLLFPSPKHPLQTLIALNSRSFMTQKYCIAFLLLLPYVNTTHHHFNLLNFQYPACSTNSTKSKPASTSLIPTLQHPPTSTTS